MEAGNEYTDPPKTYDEEIAELEDRSIRNRTDEQNIDYLISSKRKFEVDNKCGEEPMYKNPKIANAKNMRVQYLTKLPQYIGFCLNNNDMSRLKSLINSTFIENCALKTSTLTNEIYGRHRIIEGFASVLRSTPDFVINIKPSVVNHRMISAKMNSNGTIVYNNSSDYLWNYLKHSKDSKKIYPISSEESSSSDTSPQSKSLLMDGKKVYFEESAEFHLIMNEEKTFIEKFIHVKFQNEFTILDNDE
jgi:hypothetical protein